VLITPGSSIAFPWISTWPLGKPHVDYCVDQCCHSVVTEKY